MKERMLELLSLLEATNPAISMLIKDIKSIDRKLVRNDLLVCALLHENTYYDIKQLRMLEDLVFRDYHIDDVASRFSYRISGYVGNKEKQSAFISLRASSLEEAGLKAEDSYTVRAFDRKYDRVEIELYEEERYN